MEFSFETQGAGTYLVHRLSDSDVVDSLSLGMLANNRITGVAPVLFTQQDENRYLKYNISAKVPVGKFFTGDVTKKRMLGVLAGIAGAMLEADEYMLAADRFVLDRDYIFADVTTCESSLIYLPIKSDGVTPDMAAFFKDIVFGAQYDQSENSDYVAKLISFLNGADVFSVSDFAALIKRLSESAEAQSAGVQNGADKQAKDFAPPVDETPGYTPPSATKAPQYTPAAAPEPRPPLSSSVQQAQPTHQAPPAAPARSFPQTLPVPPRRAPETAVAEAPRAEKEISLLHLMMHYSKKNKEAYKAQKRAKAGPGAAPVKTARRETGASREASAGFAIPGAAAPIDPAAERRQATGEREAAAERASRPSVQAYQSAPVQANAQGRGGNFGETVVLDGGAGRHTLNLSDGGSGGTAGAPYLIRVRNNEKVNLSKPVFRIGKERSFADYFIGDNTAVSRSHAEFISRGGEYYVADMNSTNHTYVNGEMLQGGVEARLAHGDKVKLADEEFEFRLY
jgi:hypothetical protein